MLYRSVHKHVCEQLPHKEIVTHWKVHRQKFIGCWCYGIGTNEHYDINDQ